MVEFGTLLSMKDGAVSNNVKVTGINPKKLSWANQDMWHFSFKAPHDLCLLSLTSLTSFPNTLLLAYSVSATLPS